MGVKLRKNSAIKTALGTYQRAVETTTHIYFVDYGTKGCLMYNRKMELVSNDALAELKRVLKKDEVSWKSKEIIENKFGGVK